MGAIRVGYVDEVEEAPGQDGLVEPAVWKVTPAQGMDVGRTSRDVGQGCVNFVDCGSEPPRFELI